MRLLNSTNNVIDQKNTISSVNGILTSFAKNWAVSDIALVVILSPN